MTSPVSVHARRRAGPVLRRLVQFVAFQVAWFACVLGAATGRVWIGLGLVGLSVAVHIARSTAPGRSLGLIGLALAIGLCWDTLLELGDWVQYAAAGPLPWPWAPAWILALWALFATLLSDPLRWLQGRPVLAAAFGAVGGPLSYAAAERLGACRIPDWTTAMILLAVGWGVIVPVLVEVARPSPSPAA